MHNLRAGKSVMSTTTSTYINLDEARERLLLMQEDPKMVTKSMYSPTASAYPGGQLPFVEVHLAYLRKNKLVDPTKYISNLAIMITQR